MAQAGRCTGTTHCPTCRTGMRICVCNLRKRCWASSFAGLKVAKSKRSGELYAQAALEDTFGKIDLICFPKDYPRMAESLKIDVPVLVRGQLRAEEDAAPKLAVSSVQALEDVKVRLPQNVRIKVTLDRATDQTLLSLHAMIQEAPGPGKLMINLEQRG